MEGVRFVWDESDEDVLFSIPGEGGEDDGVGDGELAVDLKSRMCWHPRRTVCQRKRNLLCIHPIWVTSACDGRLKVGAEVDE
jgi:hypothetical protein